MWNGLAKLLYVQNGFAKVLYVQTFLFWLEVINAPLPLEEARTVYKHKCGCGVAVTSCRVRYASSTHAITHDQHSYPNAIVIKGIEGLLFPLIAIRGENRQHDHARWHPSQLIPKSLPTNMQEATRSYQEQIRFIWWISRLSIVLTAFGAGRCAMATCLAEKSVPQATAYAPAQCPRRVTLAAGDRHHVILVEGRHRVQGSGAGA